MLFVLGLFATSYILFAFVSESLNPFAAPRSFAERRVLNFSRAAALVSFFAGAIALLLYAFNIVEQRAALITYLAIGSVLVIPFVIKYKNKASWQ